MSRSWLLMLCVAACTTGIGAGASAQTTPGGCRYTFIVAGAPQPSCPTTATAADAVGHTVQRDYLHSQVRLSGELVNALGEPASDVAVDVVACSLAGTGFTIVATTTTTPAGRYAVIAPRGGPRLLLLMAGGSEAMIVRELVSPSVWMRVAARPHGLLTFFGKIWTGTGGPAPPIVLQDRTPNGWRTFAATMVNSRNRFRTDYRSAPGTVGFSFAFRATTLPVADWRPGVSSARTTTIQG